MLQNNLKLLMVKNHKTIKQVSQETGIKKGSLEMYVLGRDIMVMILLFLLAILKLTPSICLEFGILQPMKNI